MSNETPRAWLTSYAPGVPHEIELPDGSLFDLVEGSVERFGEHVALEFCGATTTYAELGEPIAAAAEGLRLRCACLSRRRGSRVMRSPHGYTEP